MKSLLILAGLLLAFSSPLLKADNLITNGDFETGNLNGWAVQGSTAIDSGTGEVEGAYAANLDPSSNNYGTLSQTFETTPGVSYVLQYDGISNQTFESYVSVTGSNTTIYNGSIPSSSTFTTHRSTFVAVSGTTQLTFGADYGTTIIDNVIVSTGSFSAPGRYTGSVKITTSVPSQNIASLHTESIVARITPTGGISTITQPNGSVDAGGFADAGMLLLDGTSVPFTIKGKTVTFTVTTNNGSTPASTETTVYRLHKVDH